MSEPILTEVERHSAVWQKLEQFLDAELAVLRKKNDGDHDVVKTARIRGAIDAVKKLKSLGIEKQQLPSGDALFKD